MSSSVDFTCSGITQYFIPEVEGVSVSQVISTSGMGSVNGSSGKAGTNFVNTTFVITGPGSPSPATNVALPATAITRNAAHMIFFILVPILDLPKNFSKL